MYASAETLVRFAEHLDLFESDAKSRRLAGLIEKIAHFQIGNSLVLSFDIISFLDWHKKGGSYGSHNMAGTPLAGRCTP
jgi:hypothetical protein